MDIEVIEYNKEKEEIMLRFPDSDYLIDSETAIKLGADLWAITRDHASRKL